jgi:hypothetical protein
MIRPIDEGLWVADQDLSVAGCGIGARMTILQVGAGSLALHSPIAWDESLRAEVELLGEPRWAIAPNRFHHLFVEPWAETFADLELWVAPGLEAKRPDLSVDAVFGNSPTPAAWNGVLDALVFEGYPFASEVVFRHAASRTLVLTDLAFNFGEGTPTATRIVFGLLGAYGKFGPSFLERVLFRDRAAARRSLETVLSWDFDRIIVSHGSILETGGRGALADAYAWLLR